MNGKKTKAIALLLCLFELALFLSSSAQASANAIAALATTTPLNLTNDAAAERAPSVAVAANGDVVVAWEQDVNSGGTLQREVFARTAVGGISFGAKVNLSQDTSDSREPYLFPVNPSNVYAVYRDYQGTNPSYKGFYSTESGGSWTLPPTRFTSAMIVDPAGVQSSNGSVWFVWQEAGAGTWTDVVVKKLGGATYNLSNDGSAARYPAIAAGANGAVFVAWPDHANEKPGIVQGIKVRKWNGSNWVALPDPTNDGYSSHIAMAFHGSSLYLIWKPNGSASIKERIWNGSSWGAVLTVATGSINSPRLFIPASGNVFVAWESGGAIYLKKNSDAATVVSSGISNAHDTSLFVDTADVAHLAFQNGDVWYVQSPQ